MKKKNEFNQQKFIRAKRDFDPNKKMDQIQYFERLAIPKHHKTHTRVQTLTTLASPIETPTLKSSAQKNPDLFTLASPKNKISMTNCSITPINQVATPGSLFRPRFQSMVGVQRPDSPSNRIEPSSFFFAQRPQTGNPDLTKGKRGSYNLRPASALPTRGSPKQRFSMQGAPQFPVQDPRPSPKSPRARVSIFETYKDPNILNARGASENQKLERKFKQIMLRKKERRKLIQSFGKFFVRCDVETVAQTEESKQIDAEFKRFGTEYQRMQSTANRNVERLDLHTSDTKFNQMKAQFKFKRKVIEHLLARVGDKQDLLSMYMKQISMEDNIDRSRMMLKEK